MSNQAGAGRQNQKQRSRADLLRAARRIIQNGGQPTVSEVADAAGISRATAYRYFSNSGDLIQEALLDAVADVIRLPPPDANRPQDVAGRLDDLMRQVGAMVAGHEAMFRAFLVASLTGPVEMRRGGRRLDWLRTVLLPLEAELPTADFERLLHALSLLSGIETLIVLRDVCHLSTAEANAVTRWAAQALLWRTVEHGAVPPHGAKT